MKLPINHLIMTLIKEIKTSTLFLFLFIIITLKSVLPRFWLQIWEISQLLTQIMMVYWSKLKLWQKFRKQFIIILIFAVLQFHQE